MLGDREKFIRGDIVMSDDMLRRWKAAWKKEQKYKKDKCMKDIPKFVRECTVEEREEITKELYKINSKRDSDIIIALKKISILLNEMDLDTADTLFCTNFCLRSTGEAHSLAQILRGLTK